MWVWLKIPSTRFYNRIIASYRTIICLFLFHSPKSLPVKFQQMNSRGGQKQSKGTSQTRSYQGNQHIKNGFNRFKIYSSKIRNKPITKFRPSIHQSKHYTTLSSPTLRSASGQGERPGGSPGFRTLRGVAH